MKHFLMGLFCVLLSSTAFATGRDAMMQRVRASMLVSGSIEVTADGSVRSYAIDHPEKLPPGVVDLIEKYAPAWKFEPIVLDGKPVPAKAVMSLRIVAKRIDDKNYSIGIAGAQFGKHDAAGENTSYKERKPAPRYPEAAVRAGASGTVYVLVRIGRQGTVEDAIAEQVNLAVIASEPEMRRWRMVLADAAVDAIKHWTFNIPTTGEHVTDNHWEARIPVDFNIGYGNSEPTEDYGQWKGYVPGPRQLAPWFDKNMLLSGDVDALPAGGLFQINQSLHLITPVGGA